MAGIEAYNLWDTFGKSAPVLMDTATRELTAGLCASPVAYGLPKENSLGTFAFLSSTGDPSVAGGSFQINVSGGRPNTFAQFFWGPGARNFSLFGGSLYVRNPIQRGTVFSLNSQGEGSVNVPIPAGLAGTKRFYQVWYRDNQDPFGIGLSNALAVDFCD